MNVTKLNCPNCGAPISFPEDLKHLNCASCGSFLGIERGDGYVTLRMVEKLTSAIENSGKGMQAAIRDGSEVTRSELRRLQSAQEISSLQIQLSSIQAEIRLMERETIATANSQTQLLVLHASEFDLMEQIFTVKRENQEADPTPEKRIKIINEEIAYITKQMAAIQNSNHTRRTELYQGKYNEQRKLKQELFDIQLLALKKQYPSFLEVDPPLDDRAKVVALLNLVNKDVQKMQTLPSSPVVDEARKQIHYRQSKLSAAYHKMEDNRLSALLGSLAVVALATDMDSLMRKLSRIDEDMVVLGNQPASQLTMDYQRKLQAEQKKTQKQIKRLERKQKRQAKRDGRVQQKVESPADLPQEVSSLNNNVVEKVNISTPDMVMPSEVVETSMAGVVPENFMPNAAQELNVPVEFLTLDKMPPIDIPTPSVNGSTTVPFGGNDAKAIGGGCLLAIGAALALFSIGALVISPSVNAADDGSTINATYAFLVFLVSLIGGIFVLYKKSMPATIIKGIKGLPDIRLPHNKSGKGFRTKPLAKIINALAVVLIGWSVVLILTDLVEEIEALFLLTCLFGSGVPLLLAGIAYKQTELIE